MRYYVLFMISLLVYCAWYVVLWYDMIHVPMRVEPTIRTCLVGHCLSVLCSRIGELVAFNGLYANAGGEDVTTDTQ